MRRVSWTMFFVLVLMLALAQQRSAHAGIIKGSLSLDTSGLSGTFELALILIDGSATGDANNTVTLGNFGFGGGSAGAVDPLLTTSGASGDFAGGVALTDSEFFNVFAQAFTAGTALTFDFGLTNNVDAGGTPDQFSIALLQSDGTLIPSSDPSGALLVVNIDSARPGFLAFATDLTPAPKVTFAASVPEPPSSLLLAIGLVGLAWCSQPSRRRLHEPTTQALQH
jgi:PEP-CTERM motif-containing protein